MDEQLAGAKELYERAIFNGQYDVLPQADRELDAVEAALLIGRGRVMHGRYLETRIEVPEELPAFERAADLYRALGDERGEAEAQFWIGCFHQVVRDDNASAVPPLTAASELARKTGDQLTLSYALRHLGIAAHMAGDLEGPRLARGVHHSPPYPRLHGRRGGEPGRPHLSGRRTRAVRRRPVHWQTRPLTWPLRWVL